MPVALIPYVMAVVLIGCFGMFRVILHWYITEVHNDPARSEDGVVFQSKASGN